MTLASESTVWNAMLLAGVLAGNMRDIKAALSAGASVDGNSRQPCPPIVAATWLGNFDLVKFLLVEHKADPDTPVPRDRQAKVGGDFTFVRGQRALHLAAALGCMKTIGLLLQAGADPNCADKLGRTPLMTACACMDGVETVLFLLEKGADPTKVDTYMHNLLHVAALHNRPGLIDVLHSKVPGNLNRYNILGKTPLCLACAKGHDKVVSRLLALGAKQQMPLKPHHVCPLAIAVKHGHAGVVRLIVEEGLEAVGGKATLRGSIDVAIRHERVRILKLLLGAHGKAEHNVLPRTFLLSDAAGLGCRAAVGILLRAGEDEAALDSRGRLARDIIGTAVGPEELPMARRDYVAIQRMLAQAAAHRAWSWLWPVDDEDVCHNDSSDVDGDSGSDGDDLSPKSARKNMSGMRALASQSEGIKLRFGRLLGRYAAKK